MPIPLYSKAFSSGGPRKGDMLKYLSQLPKLPVPELEDTAATYLQSIKPLVSSQAHYDSIKAKLDEFIAPGGLGEVLQQRLKNRAAEKENWISEWWDTDAYMAYRDPVVPYVSYFFSHAHNLLPPNLEKSQLQKATLLISKVLEFKQLTDTETFPPELAKDTPYCMNGFTLMFNNSRIPKQKVDDTVKYSQTDPDNQFLIVIKNNRFYKLYHQDKNGNKLGLYDIYHNLTKIAQDADAKNAYHKQPSVGVLTSLNRDAWYDNFTKLYNYNPINSHSFEDIFRSSFVLCLDDSAPVSLEERSRNCWHGNGTNRYFDKPVQFFVAANGASGFLGEHSRMDGTPNLTLNNYICQELSKYKDWKLFDLPTANAELPEEPKELKFDISDEIQANIVTAKKSFDELLGEHALRVWRYQGYGKNQIKQFKSSPDAFIQILIQLAYYKYTGTLKPTYESATTRKYKFGRTETNRSVTSGVKTLVETWVDPKASNADKIAAFRGAIGEQNSYIKKASQGLAVDRHIFGLKKLLQPGEESPFLSDSMTSYSSTWYISDSQLSSEYFNGYGWSQVHELGFGLAYMINKEWLNINIVCKKGNSAGLNPDHFHYYLTIAADELKQVLSSEKPKL